MDPNGLARIERLNYVLTLVLSAVAVAVFAQPYSLGFAVGALIGSVNFSVIRRLVQRWMHATERQRAGTALLFLPKMIALMAAVFLAIKFLPVSPAAFAVGFSVFFVSILVETIRFAVHPRESSEEPLP